MRTDPTSTPSRTPRLTGWLALVNVSSRTQGDGGTVSPYGTTAHYVANKHSNSAKRLIDAVADFTGPPDYEPFFEERQDQYAKRGLAAYSLTEEIRKKYGIPAQERGEWDPAAHLAKVREQVAEERRQRRDRVAQLPSVI